MLFYRTMLRIIVANAKCHAINYSCLTKLKVEMPKAIQNKSRNTNTFYRIEVQQRFLDICGYKYFLHSPGFDTL